VTIASYLDSVVLHSKVPGIQYLAVDAAATIFEHAAGWADVRTRSPMTPSTTMMAYSMSKPVTAAAVLALADTGRLALDDPLDRYFESSPYGAEVTIRELLAHTSGIPNPIPLRWVHLAEQHATFDERAARAAVLRRHHRLSSAPGTRYAYSNIGYWLLGAVVERVSGQSFIAYVRDHVLSPLGIAASELGYEIADPARHAAGYVEKYSLVNVFKRLLTDEELVDGYEGRWLRVRDHYPNGPAFGGLVGSARGFGRFLSDQLRDHSALFSEDTQTRFYSPQRTRTGMVLPMTLGWHIENVDGARFFFKEGGGGGFHSMMRIYPSARVATVMMTNATRFDVWRCLAEVDRLILDQDGARLREPRCVRT
jgi:CubicO group peptidase (beta-lactamase class C family)